MISETHVPRAQFNRLYSEAMSQLAAVTAERDQARQNALNWWAQSDKWERIARDEREKGDQARQMLADAPHEPDCFAGTYDEEPCTCWKAGL